MRRFLLLALALLAASCSSHHTLSPASGPAAGIPRPDSPANSVRAVLECWRGAVPYAFDSLLTDDFRFVFAPGDSAGIPWQASAWTLELEAVSAELLLHGGGSHPPATDIVVTFDPLLVAMPDPRPGMDTPWHKLVRTGVHVTLTEHWTATPTTRTIDGFARFYLVRGDSVLIPPQMAARGWKPDSTRWWLQRWEDETLPPAGSKAWEGSDRQTSWGRLKVDYL